MDRHIVRLPFLRSFVIVCASLLIGSAAQSQITNLTAATNTPTPGTGHDYITSLNETVNPVDGSVSVRISLPVPKGRSLTLPFAFTYDSNFAGLQPNPSIPGSVSWANSHDVFNPGQPSQHLITGGGWSNSLPQLTAVSQQFTLGGGPGSPPPCYSTAGYMFKDPSGGRHALRLSAVLTSSSDPGFPNCGAAGWSNYLTGGDDFFQAVLRAGLPNVPDPASGNVQIADPSGTVYSFSSGVDGWSCVSYNQSVTVAYSMPNWIEDRNGNRITISHPCAGVNFSISDTAGRTAALGFQYANGLISSVAVSGIANSYNVTWGSFPGSVPLNYVPTGGNTGSHCHGIGAWQPGGTEISLLTLPNNQHYKFEYNTSSGLLSKITYPTGATVSYTWGVDPLSDSISFADDQGNPDFCQYHYDRPALLHRYVSFDGATTALQQDFSYTPTTTWQGGQWITKHTTVTTTDFIAGTTFTTDYSYSPNGQAPPPNSRSQFSVQIPVETTVTYHDTNGHVLRTVSKSWLDQYEQTGESQTLDNGSVSSVSYTWGPGHTITDKKEYDFGVTTPPTRETVTHYHPFLSTRLFTSAPSILDRPSTVQVYGIVNGVVTLMSETDYAYDSYPPGGLTPVTAVGHDDMNYPATYANRGNATTETVKCLQSGCGNAVTSYTFDQTGQVTSVTDSCGNGTCSEMTGGTNHTTTYSYADQYSSGTPPGITNAYLTKVTNPLGHFASYTYGYADGQLTSSVDPNTQTTTYKYGTQPTGCSFADYLDRLSEIDYPDGGSTTLCYNDAPYNASTPSPSVTTSKAIVSGVNEVSTTAFDGLGRAVETILSSDPDGTTYTVTRYDGNGRPYQVYNPTRCNPPTTYCLDTLQSDTWGYTTYLYDAFGRPKQITDPDGSIASTSYSGNQTTVTDEVGNQRKSQVDSFGRVTAVWEAPNKTGYNYETDYQYDALGNLLCAVQKGTDTSGFTTCASAPLSWRPRSFVYDSLSRVTGAVNPESGTISYSYDLNGNLLSRIAPKPDQTGTATVTTNYAYDVLNRLTQKSYVNLSTPAASYGYDGTALSGCNVSVPSITNPTNLVGRRSAMCFGNSSSSFSYDKMGRTLFEGRNNKGSVIKEYTIGYTYFLNGPLAILTYPSGDVLYFGMGLAGRYVRAVDASNQYIYNVVYTPGGSLIFADRSNVYPNSWSTVFNVYNNRQQPVELSVLPVPNPGAPIWGLCYDFHFPKAFNNSDCQFSANTTGNNGNVFEVDSLLQGFCPSCDPTHNAVFFYDPLNRLSQANTVATTGPNCWGETYTIDAWGNLTNRSGVTGMTGCSTEGLNAAPASTKNQLNGPSYDAAGNEINDHNGNLPTYDAENRIITDAGVTYSYDADGMRIEKSSGTMYWPGSDGEVLTETDLTGTIKEEYIYFNGERIARVDRPSGTVHYYFSDRLGSAAVITDIAGNIQERYYYYPYGGLVSSTGTDPNHYKFTGKERDAESGLDNFVARHYGSSLGRFMSPDPLGGRLVDPQTLNRYSYVRNNPINLTDPTGLYICADRKDCSSPQDKAFETARQQDLQSKDSDVIRAASAYGDPTKDNGVNVSFADLSKKSERGDTTSSLGTDSQGNLRANSNVVIDSKASGDRLDEVVGHEGSHVADAQDIVKTISASDAAPYFKVGMDITQYQSEQRAFHVSDSILRSENQSDKFNCGMNSCFLGTGLAMRGQVTAEIDQILQHNYKSAINNKPLTPSNQGGSVLPIVPH